MGYSCVHGFRIGSSGQKHECQLHIARAGRPAGNRYLRAHTCPRDGAVGKEGLQFPQPAADGGVMPTTGADNPAPDDPGVVLAEADRILRRGGPDVAVAMLDAIVELFGAARADLWQCDTLEPIHMASSAMRAGAAPLVPVTLIGEALERALLDPLGRTEMLVAGLVPELDVEVHQLSVHGFGPDPGTFVAIVHERLSPAAAPLLELFIHRIGIARARTLTAGRRDSTPATTGQPGPGPAMPRVQAAPSPSSQRPAATPPLAADADVAYIPPRIARRLATAGSAADLFQEAAVALYDEMDLVRVALYGRHGHRLAETGDPSSNPSRERGLVLDVHDGVMPAGRRMPRHDIDAMLVPIRAGRGPKPSAWAWFEWDCLSSEPDREVADAILEYAATVLAGMDAFHTAEEAYEHTIAALQQALLAADRYTGEHGQHVAEWSAEVATRMGLAGDDLRNVEVGALLHDIGKIAIPRSILDKPGALTEAEFGVMKAHTIVGEQIIGPVASLQDVRGIVRHEHERWDGRGYPDGLAGEEIPMGSRIILVCDAYHAITSDRPYRKGRSADVARAVLEDNAGTQFDPAIVATFLEMLDDAEACTRIERRAHRAEPPAPDSVDEAFAAWHAELRSGSAVPGPTQEERHGDAPQFRREGPADEAEAA